MKKRQAPPDVRPEFRQQVGNHVVSESHAVALQSFGRTLALGVIEAGDGDDAGVTENFREIEATAAAVLAVDEDPRGGVIGTMPGGSRSQTEEPRIFVQQAGHDRFRNVAADDLIADRAAVILGKPADPAVVAETARGHLALEGKP